MRLSINSDSLERPLQFNVPNALFINPVTFYAINRIIQKNTKNKFRFPISSNEFKKLIKVIKKKQGGSFVLVEIEEENGEHIIIEL